METASDKTWRSRFRDGVKAIRGSLVFALVVVLLDVVFLGGFLLSVMICPLWFIAANIGAIVRDASWQVSAARVAIPVVTPLVVFAMYSWQNQRAMAKATEVVQACEQYRIANGRYPARLDDVVPRYLTSIPRAKYCFMEGEFRYFYFQPSPILIWYELPPFGRRIYNFERGSWRYLD